MAKKRHDWAFYRALKRNLNWEVHWHPNRLPLRRGGFTLVELTVSMAIAGFLMLGLSVFFSSTFQNMFQAQVQEVNTQRQFAINEIIRAKFNDIIKVVAVSQPQDDPGYVIAYTKAGKNQLPITYIGTTEIDGKTHLAFKDLFIFNGVSGVSYSDSGNNEIKRVGGQPITGIQNPGGYAVKSNQYYVALPLENKIQHCIQSTGDCGTTFLTPEDYDLNHPTDIAAIGSDNLLYVTDSGSGNVISINPTNGFTEVIASDLNFPTGIVRHNSGSKEFLYVSETLNHRVLKIDLADNSVETAIGGGDDESCNGNSQLCKLNLPTGLNATGANELYISDSGNDRILRLSDPGLITNASLNISFEADDSYAIDQIKIINDEWVNANETFESVTSTLVSQNNDWNENTKIFKNSDQLNVYHDTSAGSICQSGPGVFFTNQNPFNSDIRDGNILKLGQPPSVSAPLTVNGDPSQQAIDCFPPEGDATDIFKFRIDVTGDASGYGNNALVHLSNPASPTPIEMNFNNATLSDGYQTFKIEIQDKFDGLVETEYFSLAVGNEIIGTPEDNVEVYAQGLNFPTGLSEVGPTLYFADTLGAGDNLKSTDGQSVTGEQGLNPISTASLSDFDFISDFEIDSLVFNRYNSNKILEMVLQATDQTYNLKTDL